MVYDTLFAIDTEFAPQPQMVGEYSRSADKLTYQFKLRDGLGFHPTSAVLNKTDGGSRRKAGRATRRVKLWC